MKKYLGIDVGGTYIKYGTYTINGEEVNNYKVKTDTTNLETFVNTIVTIIEENNEVDGIGVSLPGFIDINTGQILDPGAIEPLRGQNLKEIIFNRCGKEVDIENDANCVALAEKWIGKGKGYSNFFTLTIGTGIGGGIIINDRLFRGNKFMAGEFGYMIVDGIRTNPKASTASTIASTYSLVQTVATKKGINVEDLNGEKIFKMLVDKDEETLEIYNKWIENISLTIYNLVYSFNPDSILIGGGVSSQVKVIEDIRAKVDEFDERTTQFVDIDSCKFNNDSGKIGAIYNHLVNNNKI